MTRYVIRINRRNRKAIIEIELNHKEYELLHPLFMPSVNYPVFFFQSVQPLWVCKIGSFLNLHWWIIQTPKVRAPRGVRNMLPQKILKSWCSETSFLMFWEDKLCLKCSFFMPIFMFTTLHTSTPISGVHYGTWNYRRLILRYQKGKNGWETTEKWQRIVLKKTGWTKKTLSFFGKEEFQNLGEY